jgi:hypothetical protein
MLFTENETNFAKLWGGENPTPFVKDAFHTRIVEDNPTSVNPEGFGTKGAAWYNFQLVPPGESAVIRFKLTNKIRHDGILDEEEFDETIARRKAEADAFYAAVADVPLTDDMRNIQRQAWAGMLWSKQYYHFIYKRWIEGDEKGPPPPPGRKNIRNKGWDHMYVDDILSMVTPLNPRAPTNLLLGYGVNDSLINGNTRSLQRGIQRFTVSPSQ